MKTFILFLTLWFCILPGVVSAGHSNNGDHGYGHCGASSNNPNCGGGGTDPNPTPTPYSSSGGSNDSKDTLVGVLIGLIIAGFVWFFVAGGKKEKEEEVKCDTKAVTDANPELPNLGTEKPNKACRMR